MRLELFTSRANRKAAIRQAVIAHNATHEEKLKRLFPIVRDPAMPTPPVLLEPKQEGYTKPAKIGGVLALAMALMAKSMSIPNRFRGHVPNYLSKRAQARAAGYANQREKIAYENAERLRQKAAEDVEKAKQEAARLEAGRESLVKDGILLAEKPTLDAAPMTAHEAVERAMSYPSFQQDHLPAGSS